MDSRRTAVLALLVYTTFIVYQSLAHGGAWACAGDVLGWGTRLSRSDLLANIVAYVPLGLLFVQAMTGLRLQDSARHATRIPKSGAPRSRALVTALVGVAAVALLSLSMELVQSCQANRVSSVYDLMANATGGALGVFAGLAFRSSAGTMGTRASSQAGTHAGRLRLLTLAVVVAWVVSQTAPWVFAVDLGTLRSNLSFLRHWSDGSPFDAWRVLRHAGAWVAVACACRLAAPDRWVAGAGLALTVGASLMLQVLMDARAPLSFEELGGMVVAAMLVLPALASTRELPRQPRWAAGALLGAMVTVAAYQLRPEPGAATQAFNWWPQVGLGGLRGALDYALLFGWFGLVAVVAAHWADPDGQQHARRAWPVAAVLLTLVLEVMQTRIPGRGPDLSAPLFTLLAVLAGTALLGHAPVRET
jgi:VanZ family protein